MMIRRTRRWCKGEEEGEEEGAGEGFVVRKDVSLCMCVLLDDLKAVGADLCRTGNMFTLGLRKK
jgi:hypothetical protein